MEDINARNVGEQDTGEMSVSVPLICDTNTKNNLGDSEENVVGASDALVESETSNRTDMPVQSCDSTTSDVSSSVESDCQPHSSSAKITFKVPILSKVIHKPKTPEAAQSKSRSKTADAVNTGATSDNLPSSSTSMKDKKAMSLTSSSSELDHVSAEKPHIQYKEPEWGGLCPEHYSFEVLKMGTIIDNIDLIGKGFLVFGRLPSCDVTLEHPSLSRHHAVLQYCHKADEQYEQGWYLYDLGSTHGTWINKSKIPAKVYCRVKVDYVVKFGGSTRLFIMQGPKEDVDEESSLSVTEIKEQREKQKLDLELKQKQKEEEEEQKKIQDEQDAQDKGCSWGIFDDDIAEDGPEGENPFALPDLQNEDLYVDDPKKALKSYYEREGLDPPEYNFEDVSYGQHKCTIELPIDDTNTGKPIIVEVQVSGKKKEAVVQCALEACRMLDRYGELRKANQESRKKKVKNWEEQDYYDSDDDTYLDRTGEIERKRQQRMKKAGKLQEKADTYESLVEKLTEVQNQVKASEEKLSKARKAESDSQVEGLDALDAFMTSIKSGAMDTKTRMKLKVELLDLRKEQQRLEKLVNVARPPSLPPVKKMSSAGAALPMVGKVRALSKNRIKGPALPPSKLTVAVPTKDESDDEEEDEDAEAKPKPEVKKIKLFSVQKEPVTEASGETLVSKDTEPSGKDSKLSGESIGNNQKTVLVQEVSLPTSTISESDDTIQQHKKEIPRESKTQTKEEDDQAHSKKTEVETKPEKSGGRRRKGPPVKSTGEMVKKLKQDAVYKEYSADDPDYSVWVPPKGQTGDGKTSLNEKFGY